MASSGNFPLWSPLIKGATNLSLGNTRFDGTTNSRSAVLPFTVPTGTKFYVECLVKQMTNYNITFGLVGVDQAIDTYLESQSTVNGMIFHGYSSGDWRTQALVNGSRQGFNSLSDDSTATRVLGMTINTVDNEIKMYIDNTLIGNGTISISATQEYRIFCSFTGGAQSGVHMNINCGHDASGAGDFTSGGGNADENGFGDFQNSPPSGFLALCSANLPISDDIDPAQTDDDIPTKQFNAVVYTGNGSTQSISVGFKPDLVWYKRRDTTNPGVLMDSSRGVSEALEPNSNASADTNFTQGVTSFDTNGFSLGSQVQGNGSGGNLIAWCWRANGGTTASNSEGNITSTVQANTKAGFSIITYTGSGGTVSGANPTFGHGLESAPDFLIFKCRNTGSTNWIVWHSGLGGANKYISLNATSSAGTDTAWLSNTAPSSTLITTDNGGWGAVNGSSRTYVCYAWHSVEGFSSFGKFEGNSDADGPFVYTGFRPRLVFCKAIDASENWQVRDTARSTFNADSQVRIYWNSSSAEGSASTASPIDFLSNGFKVRGSNSEINTSTIVYGAWGDVPFKYNNTF